MNGETRITITLDYSLKDLKKIYNRVYNKRQYRQKVSKIDIAHMVEQMVNPIFQDYEYEDIDPEKEASK